MRRALIDTSIQTFRFNDQIPLDLKLDNFLLRIEETQGIYDGTSEDIVLPVIDINAVSLGPSAVVVSDLGVGASSCRVVVYSLPLFLSDIRPIHSQFRPK